MNKIARYGLLIASAIALFGAIIHWIAPFVSPEWTAFLQAPHWVVDSLYAKTWQAYVGALGVGSLMFMCAVFAFVGMGELPRLPLTKIALITISSICVARGLLIIPAWIYMPTGFNIVGSLIWLIAGVGFTIGTIAYLRLH